MRSTSSCRLPRQQTMTELPRPANAWERTLARLGAPVDIAWLAAFRVLFGLTLAVSMARFLAYGWIDEFFVSPRFHFKYWGFSWVEPMRSAPMHTLFWALLALALLVSLGALTRIASLLLVLGFSYLQLIDVTTYLNHYYLASLLGLLLACAPAGRAWSVDAWLRPGWRRQHAPAGVLWLFRVQVGVVYTFAGLAKAHGDWLLHAQPLRIWLNSHTDMPWVGWLLASEWTAVAMSWGGFLFDTTVPWFLLWRRSRAYAYAALVCFHLAVGKLFPIGMFPVIMILAATVFFEPSWPRRLLARITAREVQRPAGDAYGPRSPACVADEIRGPSRLRLSLALTYCVVQLLLPLRFLAYGGNVRWHEQGMRLSWRVMVREKNGSVTLIVHSKSRDRTWHVAPSRYLTRAQEREMSGQPDLILQLAHHVADEFARRGLGPVEVRADTRVSLNGRRSVPMIDPQIDLTTVRDGLGRAAWILPAPDEAPPHIRPI